MFSRRSALGPLRAFKARVCAFSTVGPAYDAASVASAFLSRFQSQGPQTRTQILDANQLQLLSLTLGRPSLYSGAPSLSNAPAPANGTPVPPGYHLVYFTPAFLERDLGPDGTDASYNPDTPFTRRMWAGGEVVWPRDASGKPNLLRVGQEVQEITKVLSAEPKIVRKTGEAMIVVGVEKAFVNEDGVAVLDRRNWVFREALPVPSATKSTTSGVPPPTSDAKQSAASISPATPSSSSSGLSRRSFNRSPVTLFRFSALTLNPHKIHYSLPWARDVEGHRGLVVHGPMNLISILDLWRDVRHDEGTYADSSLIVPHSISYRATSPLYAEEDYEIVLEDSADSSTANIYNHNGVVAMKADIK